MPVSDQAEFDDTAMTARHLGDSLLVYFNYLLRVGRLPDLVNPTRFSEKLQVAKLTWRSPMMPLLADKVRVKDIVARRLGPDWVTPSLFSGPALPPREQRTWPFPYVIKTNNGSGTSSFVHSANDQQWERIERRVRRLLTRPHGLALGEWAYADITPQVLVEPLIDGAIPRIEYKLFCFAGRVEFVEVHLRRDGRRECANMDRDWVLHPFTLKYPVSSEPVPRPVSLDRMVRGAEVLAEGFPFVRIDLYEVDDRPRFGEVTFYPASGYIKPIPPQYDRIYGDLWPPGPPSGPAAGTGQA